ncbi:MAG: membrane protein of unknown function [Nitrospira sp.]|nr:MAG: membrane protein of unknown function [Nitrospira sp.]
MAEESAGWADARRFCAAIGQQISYSCPRTSNVAITQHWEESRSSQRSRQSVLSESASDAVSASRRHCQHESQGQLQCVCLNTPCFYRYHGLNGRSSKLEGKSFLLITFRGDGEPAMDDLSTTTTEQSSEQIAAAISSGPKPNDLVVFVPGLHPLWRNPRHYEPIESLLRDVFPQCELFTFSYVGTYWSSEDPEEISSELEEEIGKRIKGDKTGKSIYLVGHSFGALLLRQALLMNTRPARKVPWVDRVDRAILLAGANRGFEPHKRGYKYIAGFLGFWQWLPRRIRPGHLGLAGLRGSVWVTNLRMEWVTQGTPPLDLPLTIQIRGTQDGLVGPHDSVDITYSRKSDVIQMSGLGHSEIALLRSKRVAEIRPELLTALQKAVRQPAPPLPPTAANAPKHLVFLVHGIRDFAEWHEDLARTILEKASHGRSSVEVVSISYGYFTALQFLFPVARRRCGRAILDQYVQYKVRYPEAIFSAIAHSNGTYALTWAMQKNPFLCWKNIYLAGCVRNSNFPWQDISSQFEKVRNDCASRDWPVGALCWWLSLVPVFYRGDLGTAGVSGFSGPLVRSPRLGSYKVINNQFHDGDHSSALNPKHHVEIAEFVLTGESWQATKPLSSKPRRLRRYFYRFLTLVLVAIAVAAYISIATAGFTSTMTVMVTTILTVVLVTVMLLA